MKTSKTASVLIWRLWLRGRFRRGLACRLDHANPTANVTVNGNAAYRKGEYFDYALSTPNGSTPWYNTVTVHSAYGAGQTETGSQFVPKTPELYSYDADGNLTQDGRWNYVWDAENRLVGMASANASVGPQQSLAFEYDWQGRRIHKQAWSNATWNGTPDKDVTFLYDGWNLLAELNATNNAVIQSYVWGSDLSGSLQGAGGVGGLLFVCDQQSAIGYCAPPTTVTVT